MTAPSTDPLVAVVTPVYNGEEFLAETMESVQAMDYPRLVHVVLDNASTDATPSILRDFANRRVPLVIARNPSTLWANKNWNASLAHIPEDARYFCMLSADDTYAPGFVRQAVGLAERHPSVGVVGCAFHETGGQTVDYGWPKDRDVIPGRETIGLYVAGICSVPAPHALYRRSVLARHHPFFYESPRLNFGASDVFATLRVLEHSDLGILHDDLAMTRLHAGSQSFTIRAMERRHYYETLYLLRRFAPLAGTAGITKEQAEQRIRLYERYYIRQLLKWRFDARRPRYELHLRALAELGIRLTPAQFADAALDFPLARLGLAPVWRGYPFCHGTFEDSP